MAQAHNGCIQGSANSIIGDFAIGAIGTTGDHRTLNSIESQPMVLLVKKILVSEQFTR